MSLEVYRYAKKCQKKRSDFCRISGLGSRRVMSPAIDLLPACAGVSTRPASARVGASGAAIAVEQHRRVDGVAGRARAGQGRGAQMVTLVGGVTVSHGGAFLLSAVAQISIYNGHFLSSFFCRSPSTSPPADIRCRQAYRHRMSIGGYMQKFAKF